MIRRPPRSTHCISSAASDVYKRQGPTLHILFEPKMGYAWRRSTLPGPCGPSTIDAEGLNGRVRDGNVWNPFAIATKRLRV